MPPLARRYSAPRPPSTLIVRGGATPRLPFGFAQHLPQSPAAPERRVRSRETLEWMAQVRDTDQGAET